MGSDAATCHAAPYGPRISSIKKSISVMPVQLGTHVPNVHTQVSSAPDRAAIVRLQYNTNAMDHSSSTATVPNDSTARRHTPNRVQRGRRQGQVCPTPLKTSFTTLAIRALPHRILSVGP
jgi:hypothetical protein